MSMSSRHRALLGALLIFCIASLLIMPMRPLSDDMGSSNWNAAAESTSIPQHDSESSPISEDKFPTGDRLADPDPIDYTSLSLYSLKQTIRGTIFETSENVLDTSRSIRVNTPRTSTSKLYLEHKNDDVDVKHNNDISDELDMVDEEGDAAEEEEEEEEEEDNITDNQEERAPQIKEEKPEEAPVEEDPESLENSDYLDEFDPDQELGVQDEESSEETTPVSAVNNEIEVLDDEDSMILDGESQDEEPEKAPLPKDTSLADFDVTQALPANESYLLFIPSGETIEAQFFTLLTSLWIAKHSNRTLIIPPPMMPQPSLYNQYPQFAGPKGKKRQRWSRLFDLGQVAQSQRIKLIDDTRPVLQIPFTDEMAKEEENPVANRQKVPYSPSSDEADVDEYTTATTIKCHGPPTAGSWRTLDFAGRHFLNRYNLVADFKILEEPYWDMNPEAIQKNWEASPNFGEEDQEDRRRQLICISGAEFIGGENPEIEERIWREIGILMPFSGGIRQYAQQIVSRVLMGFENNEKRNGYIGVHIDQLPSPEFCKEGTEEKKDSYVPSFFGSGRTTSLVPSQCHWKASTIAKRVALLQRTEEAGARPVIITTTMTDASSLNEIDRQQGWLRIGSEDEGNGLFDMSVEDLGGYGPAIANIFIMSKSAVFLGNRASPLAMHASFRIKNEGRTKLISGRRPRWELY